MSAPPPAAPEVTAPSPARPAVTTRRPVVLVAGNPNAGKTTLFNALTGARGKVSNYPGVTVSRRAGALTLPNGSRAELVDLPGTYSLSARSPEEQVAVDAVLGREDRAPEAVVVVADATALTRNLYLALQIVETGVPTVVALSMIDEAAAAGIVIDERLLSERLGAEVVPVLATAGRGLPQLLTAVRRAIAGRREADPIRPLDAKLEGPVGEVEVAVRAWLRPSGPAATRAWALWALLSLGDDELDDIPEGLREVVTRVRRSAEQDGRELDLEIVEARYQRIEAVIAETVQPGTQPVANLPERIDAVLTHRLLGPLLFAAVMLAVFEALFTWSQPAIGFVEARVAELQRLSAAVLPAGPLTDLLCEGVIAGVGNVIVFVPQIALLFLLIGLLEDSGYLARVAFLIDRVMGRLGLHGKAFVPMLSGFACAVPAVMATRTIESRRDRLLTMLVVPLISCSARLPVYVLVIAAVFDPGLKVLGIVSLGAVVLIALYLFSVTAALGAAAVLRRTVLEGPRPSLVLELPPYRMPVLRNVLSSTWLQVRTFLRDAGTIILAMTVLLWALLSYPNSGELATRHAAERERVVRTSQGAEREQRLAALEGRAAGERLRHSFAGRMGRALEPALEPLGLDWRIGIGLLGAFAAREAFVSTLGVVFDIGSADGQSEPLRTALRKARRSDGSKLMTPLAGLSLLVFFVLACQCMSTIAVVRRESGSWGWPAFMVGYMSSLAYAAAWLVYQTGSLLGWGLGA